MAMQNRSMMPIGITLGRCFEVEAYLGQGGFGFVSQCRNTQTGERVAIKVNKSQLNVVRIARTEIGMLRRLRCLDPDTCNIIKWNGFFFDKEQICLNFELLDQSLRDYVHQRDYWGLPMTELRPIIYQLTTALYHLHSLGIAHADLKPDNVMIVDRQQQPTRIKLIDFGLALPASQFRPGLNMGTISYKAPELMLHAPFWEAIDMWSLGITIAELATGRPLYPGNTDYDVLNFIIQTQGQPEDEMLDFGGRTHLYFKRENSQQRWRFKTQQEFAEETGCYGKETRYFALGCLDEIEQLIVTGSQSDRRLLVDVIKRMLTLNPDDRITPLEVLQHPFFAQSIPQSSHTDNLDKIEEVEDTSKQSSSNQTEGPDNVQSSETPDPQEQISEFSAQSSSHESSESQNFRCRVEGIRLDMCIEIPDTEQTPEPSQQWSGNKTAGPVNRHCRVEDFENKIPEPSQQDSEYLSIVTEDWRVIQDSEEEMSKRSSSNQTEGPDSVQFSETPDPQEEISKVSGQSSFYESSEPQNFHCRVEGTRPDMCIEIRDTEQTPESSQQWSGNKTAGPVNRHCRVEDIENKIPEPSQQDSEYLSIVTEDCRVIQDSEEEMSKCSKQSSSNQREGPDNVHCSETPDPQEQISEFSEHSSLYETSAPENLHCRIESSPADTLTEPSQQCSDHQMAGPDTRHCRVEGPRPNIYIEISDTEQTPEPNKQCPGYKTAGPVNRHCRVESLHPNICIQIPDSEEASKLNQQTLVQPYQTLVPENVDCIVEIPNADEDSSPAWIGGQQGVQPETNTDDDGWLRRLVKSITDTIYYYLRVNG